MSTALRAPFPWFGGKSRVADVVWRAFGRDVPNYVEPFAGSLAVLLGRPGGAGKIETVNDLDCYVSNFWRAVSADPEAVARFADWPVNEADLHARHLWLVGQAEFRERMHTDPDFFDAKIAGWWTWGLSQWIGSGWCDLAGRPKNQRPFLGHVGMGVHSISGRFDRGWFGALAMRLRTVRVCCGEWSRVLGNFPRVPCGIFLDPPYDPELRDRDLYASDRPAIAADVRRWAVEHGDDRALRIALCGYEGEHEMPDGWTCHAWKSTGTNDENAASERIWFSPHCLPIHSQRSLFDGLTGAP